MAKSFYRAQFHVKEREPKTIVFNAEKKKPKTIVFNSSSKSPKILTISDLKLDIN